MSKTEELRALLDERGVEWWADDGKYLKVTYWEVPEDETALYAEHDDGRVDFYMPHNVRSRFTPKQAVDATLGRGITAEQVREAIERNFGKVAVLDDGGPVEWRDDWVCKVAIDHQAIADELNNGKGE